jgi:lactate dehydrogenase-like 2-hydroxyacid dehydrogenase
LKVCNNHKLFITPHIAWASREARRLFIARTLENIKSYLEK